MTDKNALQIHMFPCLSDNYGLLVHDPSSRQTATIDTPDAEVISRELEARHWQLTHILNTHHHYDHAGGNLQLKDRYDCRIYGPAHEAERIPGMDIRLKEGDILTLGTHEIRVMEPPGHTSGHIVYYLPQQKILFAGDTLFSVGCGRLFEGTPAQMWNSLGKIMALPEDTTIYCAHEYTLNNIEFARSIDRNNKDLERYYQEARQLRSENRPTLPTTLSLELRVNPFLRPDAPAIAETLGAGDSDTLARFAEIRRRKDRF